MKFLRKIWGQGLKKEISRHGKKEGVIRVYITISLAYCFITLTLYLLLNLIVPTKIYLNLNVFLGSSMDSALSSFIPLGLPYFILNYFLIIYPKKYRQLYLEYRNNGWKTYSVFVYCSIFSYPITVLCYAIWAWFN
jgi:magnesium-transporting ATPase (P-type)